MSPTSLLLLLTTLRSYHLCGDGWGRKQICAGTGGDGSKYLRERVVMDSYYTGTGGDGTEILSPCRPLAWTASTFLVWPRAGRGTGEVSMGMMGAIHPWDCQ